MRKLKEFKNEQDCLLSENEMLNLTGGKVISRYNCWSDTAGPDCSDRKCESTRDNDDGTTTTTITEIDN
jgi:hypothetical protein